MYKNTKGQQNIYYMFILFIHKENVILDKIRIYRLIHLLGKEN